MKRDSNASRVLDSDPGFQTSLKMTSLQVPKTEVQSILDLNVGQLTSMLWTTMASSSMDSISLTKHSLSPPCSIVSRTGTV